MHRRPLLSLIDDYGRRFPDERAMAQRFRAFIEGEPRCFERDCWRGHVTGSAWLVHAEQDAVLLTHHRKLGRWLQLGGHSDGDPESLRVAVREAEEESGLTVRPLAPHILDLDVHEIPAHRDDPAHCHFDVRFALTATGGELRHPLEESFALRWVLLDCLTDYTRETSILRMRCKWRSGAGAVDRPTGV